METSFTAPNAHLFACRALEKNSQCWMWSTFYRVSLSKSYCLKSDSGPICITARGYVEDRDPGYSQSLIQECFQSLLGSVRFLPIYGNPWPMSTQIGNCIFEMALGISILLSGDAHCTWQRTCSLSNYSHPSGTSCTSCGRVLRPTLASSAPQNS